MRFLTALILNQLRRNGSVPLSQIFERACDGRYTTIGIAKPLRLDISNERGRNLDQTIEISLWLNVLYDSLAIGSVELGLSLSVIGLQLS